MCGGLIRTSVPWMWGNLHIPRKYTWDMLAYVRSMLGYGQPRQKFTRVIWRACAKHRFIAMWIIMGSMHIHLCGTNSAVDLPPTLPPNGGFFLLCNFEFLIMNWFLYKLFVYNIGYASWTPGWCGPFMSELARKLHNLRVTVFVKPVFWFRCQMDIRSLADNPELCHLIETDYDCGWFESFVGDCLDIIYQRFYKRDNHAA